MATGCQQQVPYVRIVRTAIAGVFVDESFTIPMEEIKKCLSIAQSLTKHFNCDVALHRCETFLNWLVNILKEVIRKSKNQSDMINYGVATTRLRLNLSEQAGRSFQEVVM